MVCSLSCLIYLIFVKKIYFCIIYYVICLFSFYLIDDSKRMQWLMCCIHCFGKSFVRSLFELNFLEAKPAKGFYKLTISANPKKADSRLIGTTGAEVTFCWFFFSIFFSVCYLFNRGVSLFYNFVYFTGFTSFLHESDHTILIQHLEIIFCGKKNAFVLLAFTYFNSFFYLL